MKTINLLFLAFLFANPSFAQCYSTVLNANNTIIARKHDGTLWARGYNSSGTVGNGAGSFVNTFIQIGSDSNWSDNISISSNMAFAIKTDNTLWVWGRPGNAAGIGNTDNTIYIVPTQVGTESNWEKIATNGVKSHAIKSDGTLWSWGLNTDGGLGFGSVDSQYYTNVPIQVGTENNWQDVYCGGTGSFAIKADGTLWSWGSKLSLAGYGNPLLNNAFSSPHQIGTDTNWRNVSTQNQMAIGLKTNGTIWGWGATQNSLFGNGTPNAALFYSNTPIQIGNDTDWQQISLAMNTAVALKTNGTRWGWGYNSTHDLGMGQGNNSQITFPTQLDSDTDWVYVTIDKNLGGGLGIKQNNSLYYWGGTYYLGQQGSYYVPTLLGSTCSLNTISFQNQNAITVFPNPANNIATIQFSEKTEIQFEFNIINILGQTIYTNEIKSIASEFPIDLTNYPSGAYFVTIKSNSKFYSLKLIKN